MSLSVKKIKKQEDNPALNNIIQPIKENFIRFNKVMGESLKTNIRLLDMVWKYLLHQNGKKVRPILLLLSSGICGNIPESSLKAAVAVKLWKNKISVLTGDYLLAQALRAVVDIQKFEVIGILSDATKRITKAEIFQIENSKTLNIEEDVYIQMVSGKTAALFAACCEIGALLAEASPEQQTALKNYGENIGIAFQIRDDLFGFEGDAKYTGKPKYADLKNNMITLPLIHSLNNSSKKEKKEILKLFKNEMNKSRIKHIHDFVSQYNSIEYTKEQISFYSEQARNKLVVFPDSSYKQGLLQFVEFSVLRKK